MSTPFTKIFNNFLALVDDSSICRGLTDEEITTRLWQYLENGHALWFRECKKDLSDIEMYDYYTMAETADGSTSDFVLDKYPTDPSVESIELVFLVDDIEVEYTFDENTLTFTANSMPPNGSVVKYGYNFSGQFNEDLTPEETWILAHAMVLSWTSEKVREEHAIQNTMTTKDYVKYSPANMLNSLMEMRRKSWNELHGLVVKYTFNEFNGFDL